MRYNKTIANKLVCLFLSAIMAVVLTGCGRNGSFSAKEETSPEYVFTYAENQPEDYPTTQAAYRFAELVQEKTAGRIEILVQANGVLGDEKKVVEQLQYGGVDFTRVSISPLAQIIPKLNVLQMPYLYTGREHMWNVLNGKIGSDLMSSFDNTGMVPLSWYEAGSRNFYNFQREIKTLEDMKGLKFRVQDSELMVEMIQALGGSPITMAFTESYSALQKRVIDGAENNWPSYESANHYEVARYYTVDEHTRVPELQLISEATWKKLSEEDKKIITECALESAEFEKQLWAEREKASEQKVRDAGVQVTVLSDEEALRFQEAVKPLYEKFCGDYMDIVDAIIEAGK